MLSATSADLASCPRCSGPVRLTLGRFRRDVEGTPFVAFLGHHLRAYRREEIEAARADALDSLPEPFREPAEKWTGELLAEVEEGAVRSEDTATVLDRVVRSGARVAGESGTGIGEATALDLFEAVVLGAVMEVDDRPELRAELLEASRGPFSRYWWALLCGAVGVLLLARDPSDVIGGIGWSLLALAALPAIARWVRERAEG